MTARPASRPRANALTCRVPIEFELSIEDCTHRMAMSPLIVGLFSTSSESGEMRWPTCTALPFSIRHTTHSRTSGHWRLGTPSSLRFLHLGSHFARMDRPHLRAYRNSTNLLRSHRPPVAAAFGIRAMLSAGSRPPPQVKHQHRRCIPAGRRRNMARATDPIFASKLEVNPFHQIA
jgi:hypothetical protein